MVIFLFLRSVPATIIPSVAVPLSLVGTFGVMYLAGFSINNLTLMALIVATGFVVDDAIVMIENIARYIEEGETPLEAALKGARQIGFTIISLTLSLDRGADPAALHGRRRRAPLPRVRDHARGRDPHLGGGLADADADDVRASSCSHAPEREQGRFYRASGRMFDARDRALRPDARLGARRARRATLVVAVATLVLTVAALRRRAEGLLPGAGHRRHPGHLGSAADRSRSRRWPSASRRWREVDPAGSGGREPLVVHRRRRHQRDAQQRPHADQPEAARGQRGRARDRRDPPPAAASSRRCRGHHALHAAGAGPDDRGPRQPHAVPVHARGRRARSC